MVSKITIILLVIMLVLLWYYFMYDRRNLKKVEVNDNRSYYVIDRDDSRKAGKLLNNIVNDAIKLVNHLRRNYPNHEGVKLLSERFDPTTISEGNPHHKDFTYTENKGEKIVICLRNKEMNFHEKELIMFPLIHELSHLCDPDYDNNHGKTFRQCFRFFLDEAIKIGIIKPPRYDEEPRPYCGMVIKSVV